MKQRIYNKPLALLALATALVLAVPAMASAHASQGLIFGSAGPGQHMVVMVVGMKGLVRTAKVDSDGRYAVSDLPPGDYTVTLRQNGKIVARRKHVITHTDAANQVNFDRHGARSADTVQVTD